MIYIVQLLCPARHCLIGALIGPDFSSQQEQKFMGYFHRLVADEDINPWCHTCGSREIRAECRPTKYRTMEEAKQAAKELEAEQMETRRHIDSIRRKASRQ